MIVECCLLLAMLAMAVACTPVESAGPTAVSIAEVVTLIPATRTLPQPAATNTQTPQPPTSTPTSTPSPSDTPSPTPDFTCPEPNIPAPFTQPADIEELQNLILTYLNAGGQVADLANLVSSLEIDGDIVTVDMNGDGVLEMVLNLAVAADESEPKDHTTWVLQCRVGQYHVIYTIDWGWWYFYDSTFFDDLNGDGNSEAIIIGGFSGSACALEPTVLGWRNDSIVDYSPAHSELQLGCSLETQVILEDLDNNGVKELIIAGEAVAHLEFGPLRGITQTFSLQDQSYKLIATEFAPADSRVHVLDDAQRAFDAGDFSLAAQLYDRAATDDSLWDRYSYNYLSPQLAEARGLSGIDYPGEYQRAFALFRLAVIELIMQEAEKAATTLTKLKENYYEGMPGYEFAVLTQVFKDSLAGGQRPLEACQTITNLITANYPSLESHFYWGGNIAWYQNETLCPFTVR